MLRILRWRPSNHFGIIALVLLVASVGLWVSSYPPLKALGSAWRTQGMRIEVFSRQGSAHFVVVAEKPELNRQFETALPAYARSANYRHGSLVDLLGFEVAWLPARFNGGDYIVLPYAALAIPYWFISMLMAGVVVQWIRYQQATAVLVYRLCNVRFSLRTLLLLILVIAVMIVLGGIIREALYRYQHRNARPTTPVPSSSASLLQRP